MLFFICVCVIFGFSNGQSVPQVNTTEGLVEGTLAHDGSYYCYYGLHYGGSTSGANRFKAPTPPPIYPGVYHAMQSDIVCAQPTSRGMIGIENCLTLNVFTKNVTYPKPVLVWLNGEDYTTTNTVLNSFKRIVDNDIVVVSMNYRVSIFGFLCLGVSDAPGNAGLKDVVQGLKWIKNNIAAFGGNPNNVVVLGHGSAAAMVDLLTLSPLSQNLLHKAIAISGSALSPWAVSYDPIGHAHLLAAKLEYTTSSNEKLAQLLINTDFNILGTALTDFEQFYNNTALFAPCIESSQLNANDSFLVEAPIKTLQSGNYSHVPYIAVYSNREGTLRAEEAAYNQWLPKMQANFSDFLPVDLQFNSTTNKTAVVRSIREYYFGSKNIDMETIEDYLDYQGDTLVLVSVIRGVRERALTSREPVRLLEFAYKGTQNSDWYYQQIPLTGARHGDILKYLLDFDLRANDETIRASILGRFVAFVKTGIPSAPVNVSGSDWPAITDSSLNYLYYGGDDGPIVNYASVYVEEDRYNPHQQRMTFWNDIYFKYYQAPSISASSSVILSLSICVISLLLLIVFN